MRPAAFILTPFLLFFVLQGCASTGGVVHSRDKGKSIIYPVTKDQAWDIAKTVFRWEGAEDIEEHRNKDYILAGKGKHPLFYDSVVCAWLEPVDSEDTKVTVVSDHKRSLDEAAHFTKTTFLWRFSQAVEIIKEGRTLPAAPPD